MRWIIQGLTSARFLAAIIGLAFLYGYFMVLVVHKLPRLRLPYEIELAAVLGFTWLGWYIAERASGRFERVVGLVLLYLLAVLAFLRIVGLP
jgi:hypothetical protein